MTQLALTIAIIFMVYLIGYYVGRKQILNDIESLIDELEEKKQ